MINHKKINKEIKEFFLSNNIDMVGSAGDKEPVINYKINDEYLKGKEKFIEIANKNLILKRNFYQCLKKNKNTIQIPIKSDNLERFDMFFLECIGHILFKNNINEVLFLFNACCLKRGINEEDQKNEYRVIKYWYNGNIWEIDYNYNYPREYGLK